MAAELNTTKFEEFISDYPIYEYRLLDAKALSVAERVRIVCQQECERYGTTWACPPAVGTLKECEDRIHSYDRAVFFSSVAEVSDIMQGGTFPDRRDLQGKSHRLWQRQPSS